MKLEEARDLLRQCQRERQEARVAVKVGQATVESAQLIVQGLLRRFPELSDDEQEWGDLWEPEPTTPRGAEAVRSILQVDENKWFTVRDMTNALADRDWLPESENPPNAVRAALERLVASADSNVEKTRDSDGTVSYRYREPEPAPSGYDHSEEPF